MKSVIFTEEQLGNFDAIGASLFSDENDPTSINYNRKLIRPKINWFRVIAYLFIFSLLITGSILCTEYFSVPTFPSVLIIIAVCLCYFLLTLKAAAICAVKIYQKFAPEQIRRKCRFEPSCSEYMILAIEKYGSFKGIAKGIKRLRRCNLKDGGYDYP